MCGRKNGVNGSLEARKRWENTRREQTAPCEMASQLITRLMNLGG